MASILLPKIQLEPGPIPREERGRVLNLAVQTHYELLSAAVATLSPNGLLEDLIARHETLVREDEVRRRTFGSRILCFDATTVVDDLAKSVPRATTTAVALRFLIEYVATRPPSGLRPISVGVFDYLLAHAAEIVNRGMASDVVQYELDDIDVSVLASGRLGMSRDGRYMSGQQAFLNASMPVMARMMAESYDAHWRTDAVERADFADDLDDAGRAEFGFSLSELGALIAELVNAAERRAAAAATENRLTLVKELSTELEWDPDKVERAFDLLSLVPRAKFLQPSSPFRPSDVYPWVFNRRLSYLRRPLVSRGSGETAEVLWGMRHTWSAGAHLVNLIMSQRLNADSLEMKQFMTKVRQRESAAFNDQVAELCREHHSTVRTNVDKIGRLPISRANKQALGDIDVLCADPERRVLHLLECKDLEGARTAAELKNEIESTFGSSPKAKLQIHLERIAWVEKHVAETLGWLEIEGSSDNWTVEGRMITDIEVLAPHVLGRCPIPVLSVDSLRAELPGLAPRKDRP